MNDNIYQIQPDPPVPQIPAEIDYNYHLIQQMLIWYDDFTVDQCIALIKLSK